MLWEGLNLNAQVFIFCRCLRPASGYPAGTFLSEDRELDLASNGRVQPLGFKQFKIQKPTNDSVRIKHHGLCLIGVNIHG